MEALAPASTGKANVGPASNEFKAEARLCLAVLLESRLYPLMWVTQPFVTVHAGENRAIATSCCLCVRGTSAVSREHRGSSTMVAERVARGCSLGWDLKGWIQNDVIYFVRAHIHTVQTFGQSENRGPLTL